MNRHLIEVCPLSLRYSMALRPMMNPIASSTTPYLLMKSMNSIQSHLGYGGGAGAAVNVSLIFTSSVRILLSSAKTTPISTVRLLYFCYGL